MQPTDRMEFKIVLVGGALTGKSTFCRRLLEQVEADRPRRATGSMGDSIADDSSLASTSLETRREEGNNGVAFHRKSVIMGGRRALLNIWDNSSTQRLMQHSTMYLKGSFVILLFFAYDLAESVEQLREWLRIVDDSRDLFTTVYLVGTRPFDVLAAERARIDERVLQLARKEGVRARLCALDLYHEDSAAFRALVDEMLAAVCAVLAGGGKNADLRKLMGSFSIRTDLTAQSWGRRVCC